MVDIQEMRRGVRGDWPGQMERDSIGSVGQWNDRYIFVHKPFVLSIVEILQGFQGKSNVTDLDLKRIMWVKDRESSIKETK